MMRYLATLAFAFSAVALSSSPDYSKVNCSIVVEAGRQAGDVETTKRDVYVASGSHVEGGIHVAKNQGWSWGGKSKACSRSASPCSSRAGGGLYL
jgi:hypothetical protein